MFTLIVLAFLTIWADQILLIQAFMANVSLSSRSYLRIAGPVSASQNKALLSKGIYLMRVIDSNGRTATKKIIRN